MYLQIKKVVLWPRTAEFKPRVVSFKIGALNVITGVSKTGKSAIIPIIDYCLGADKCAIPVDTIRRACGWFGVVVDTAFGEMLMARREPGDQKATGDMFVIEGESIEIPDWIDRKNTNVDAVKVTLNERAGLTKLDFAKEGPQSAFRERPTFRDMASFTFQPQNIIANANVLFYKADSTEHREKLKTIFPYVLGAATAEVLALEHEQQRVRHELRRKERELEAIKQVSERWVSELRGKVSRARELGLIRVPATQASSASEMISLLRDAITSADLEPRLTAQVLSETADELIALQEEEAKVASSLSRLKQRFGDMTRFRDATEDYRGSLTVRRDRLQIADWMHGLHASAHECPLCGSTDTAAEAAVEALQRALRQIEEQSGTFAAVPAAFDREYQRVRDDLDRETERLNALRYHRRALEDGSTEARDRQFEVTAAARFAGSLEEAIGRYDQLAADSELPTEIAALQERLASLDRELRLRDVRGAVARTINRFTVNVARILPSLDNEWPNDPVILAPDELTLKISRQGRDDYLWEVGSGANWLAYHIATSIALHELFRDLGTSAVPGFVVYDQPSQVYFPKGIPAGPPQPTEETQPEAPSAVEVDQSADPGSFDGVRGIEAAGSIREIEVKDEDIRAVHKVFQTLRDAVRRADGAWQAIVLDHASDDIWGDVSDIHLVEEWRGGRKLVPVEWLA
jgi:hypothetical protein